MEKILVRGVNWIGDAVMTVPAVKSLREAYPDSEISMLLKPSVAPLFEKDPRIDEIILYEERYRGIGKLWLSYLLRKRDFSKAILFQNAFDAALLAFLAGVPERIGYDRDGRGILLTKRIPCDDDDRKIHHIRYYLNLLEAAGIRSNYSDPWIYLSLDERLSARKTLSPLKGPILGINPGAAYGSAKRWFPDRFAEVANWFIKDTRGSVVVFGGKHEVETAQEINKLIRDQEGDSPVLNLAGTTSLRELLSLLSECDVLVTNDSGPMHIAYAVGTPLVAVFGSTDPVLTGPAGEGHVVLNAGLSCGPCFERVCGDEDMRCMYAISSEDVYHGICELLPRRRAVFFDRDGTLCRDVGYLRIWDDFSVLPGVDGLSTLKEKGFVLIGVSNQSGIARGIVDEHFVREVNEAFIGRYGFDAFYFCPHHPDEHCSCRKPEPGMALRARNKYGIALKESFVVGDKESDLLLAKAIGAKAILVTTGEAERSQYADFTARSLREAVDYIMLET
ncbi:MAG TPA: lipopolysaccharide heptosyltransferase II [Thermodesulfovibrionales bacterium]|nr:lipopolysaccharide heptosyltransferase II [Thermodesulfovibrionales bacterium]